MNATTINPATLPAVALAERQALPDTPAIYFVLAGETVLYIGQSTNLRQRWAAHHSSCPSRRRIDRRGGRSMAIFSEERGLLSHHSSHGLGVEL